MYQSWYLLLITLVFSYGCVSSEVTNKKNNIEKISKERSICKDTILKNKSNVTEVHLTHCEALLSGKTFYPETNWYSKQEKVSFEVSKYRGKAMSDTQQLTQKIQKDKIHHAGFYFSHRPVFSINILVKKHPDTSKIKQLYNDKSWSHFVKIRQVKYSLEDLTTLRQEADNVFHRFEVPFTSSDRVQKKSDSVCD